MLNQARHFLKIGYLIAILLPGVKTHFLACFSFFDVHLNGILFFFHKFKELIILKLFPIKL